MQMFMAALFTDIETTQIPRRGEQIKKYGIIYTMGLPWWRSG